MALFITNDAAMQERVNSTIQKIYREQNVEQVRSFTEWLEHLKKYLFDATLITVVESANGQIEFVVKFTNKNNRLGLHPAEERAVGHGGLVFHPELQEWRLHS